MVVLSLSMVACGNKEPASTGEDNTEEVTEIKETITVQVEEEWLPHYEKQLKGLKKYIQMQRLNL